MRQIAERKLWIGNAGDLRDPTKIMTVGISAVVELADSEPLANLPRELIRCRFPLSDGGDNSVWLLKLATEGLASLIRANVPTLVCCAAGMSRSLCIVAAAIAQIDGSRFAAVLADIAAPGPADVSTALVAQLQKSF